MKIDEAIQRLRWNVEYLHPGRNLKGKEAIELGIEALKRVIDARRPDPLYPDTPLQGETEC